MTDPNEFRYEASVLAVPEDVAQSHRDVWALLAESGTWWPVEDVLAIAARSRAVFAQRSLAPWNRELPTLPHHLAAEVASGVDMVAGNPSGIDAEWAATHVTALGAGPYVELVSIAATVVMVDMFAFAAGVDPAPFPAPSDTPGAPSHVVPDGLGDIGAHVPMLDPFPYANVARALSFVPRANVLFRTTSVPMYSAPGMSDLVWDTPLSRPQVELVATTVAALNECFY